MIDSPDRTQVIDPVAVQVAAMTDKSNRRLDDVSLRIDQLHASVQQLSGLLSTHIKTNIEMMSKVQEFVAQQMAYRMFREDVEENKLRLEIAQKNLEIKYMEKQITSLAEENDEVETMRLNYEKQKLEAEHLKAALDLLKTTKGNTQDKIKAMAPKTTWEKARETMILTAVSVTTGAILTGVFAFIWFFIRLYISSQAGGNP